MLQNIVTYYSANEITAYAINDRASINANWTGTLKYYISVESVDGLGGADMSTESHPNPQLIGETSGDIWRRGRGITLSGIIFAQNMGALATGAEFLEQMFWETSERKLGFFLMSDARHVYYKCRVVNDLSVAVSKPQSYAPQWSWTVGLRADDPRLYVWGGTTLAHSWQT